MQALFPGTKTAQAISGRARLADAYAGTFNVENLKLLQNIAPWQFNHLSLR